MITNFKSVAVFCGSKMGNNPLFMQHAKELGKLLAQHNITMIYGGGKVGIMGAIADEMMQNNGTVIGVIPELLVEWEQQHTGITKSHVVKDMHIRKKMMYELSDAAIILPGGYGTMDEMFEVTTWNNLKIHEKKLIILNTAGFYNHLVAHIKTMSEQGFLYDDWEKRIIVVDNPQVIFSF
ncbi:MAG: TIGR00730 family Rossman fold protein [Chitinophagales bacterium]|nr:TIGR00730 family Rossman fold protein [Chitinophagales bacterium]